MHLDARQTNRYSRRIDVSCSFSRKRITSTVAFAIIGATALAVSCTSGVGRTLTKSEGDALLAAKQASQESPYRIRPGDVLEIVVWKNPDLTRSVIVRPEGMISLPLINDVPASGLTPLELRELLIKNISEYVPNPEVSVLVTQSHGAISLIGEVQNPGRFEIQGRTSVLEALALAGGLSEFASSSGIYVLRPGEAEKEKIPFNYKRALAGDPSENFELRPGDIVVVP